MSSQGEKPENNQVSNIEGSQGDLQKQNTERKEIEFYP